jgi:hypothetical protein
METEKKNTHFFVAHSIEKNQLTSDKIPQEWMTSTPAGCTLICTHMNEAFHRNRGASRPDIWELGSAGGETKTPKTSARCKFEEEKRGMEGYLVRDPYG